jgi:hypothetical protein
MDEGTHWNRRILVGEQTRQKSAEDDGELKVVYNRIPLTTVATELKKEGFTKWQRLWYSTDIGALCRLFFPTVGQRQKLKSLHIGVYSYYLWHGKPKSYLHMFRLIDNPMCPCNGGGGLSHLNT